MAFCLILVPPMMARAQETVEVPPIMVEGVNPATDELPEQVSKKVIVDQSELDAPAGPAESLARLPSVQVLSAGGPGQAAVASVRGADPSSTLATLEGVPLNSPFMGGADLAGMSLLTLDSLTLVRGGRSVTHGTDAIGGVISARLPDPLAGSDTRASIMAGSFSTARIKVGSGQTWSGRENDFGMYLSGGLQFSGGEFGFEDTNGRSRLRNHNATLGFEGMARIAGLVKGAHRLDLLVEGAWEDREIAGLEQYPSTTATQKNTRLVIKAEWKGPQLFGKGGKASAEAFYRRLGFVYDDSAPPTGPATATTLLTHGLGAKLHTRGFLWPIFALGAGLTAGFDLGQAYRLGQDSTSPSRAMVAGLLEARLGREKGFWGVTTDIRTEWDDGFGVTVVPSGGFFVDPVWLMRIFGNVSRGFRLPTLEELYFDAGFVQGNPDLIPEDAITWDAGLEFGKDKWWGLTAAYFENHLFNLIIFLPRSAFLVRAENSGRATVRGAEFEGRVAWRRLVVKSSYTFTYSVFEETGMTLPQRPAHLVQATVGYWTEQFRFLLLPSWRSEVFLDDTEALTEEARFRLDARLEWQPIESVVVSVDACNLTNKKDAVDYLQRPLPGLSIFTTLRVWL